MSIRIREDSGLFVILEGVDFSGKDTILNGVIEHLIREEDIVREDILDLRKYWQEHNRHPDLEEIEKFDVIISAEPTFCGRGREIREKVITKKNKGVYTARETAEAYAEDREILYKNVIVPSLEYGKIVMQSRSIVSSLVYQPIQARKQGEDPLTIEELLNIKGNDYVMNYPPDLLIMAVISNIKGLKKRSKNRSKKDKAFFEDRDYLSEISRAYLERGIEKVFEEKGTDVRYLNAGVNEEHSILQAVNALKDYSL